MVLSGGKERGRGRLWRRLEGGQRRCWCPTTFIRSQLGGVAQPRAACLLLLLLLLLLWLLLPWCWCL